MREPFRLSSVIDAIGNTPLIRLRHASDATGCEILGKAEFLNPGQSVKDRAALGIVRDAERRGRLRPGGRIVEGTAGNTGIGLAMVGRALGYPVTIVIPRTQSQEKKDAIRLMGAELIEVDALPYANPGNYQHVSGRLARELDHADPVGATRTRPPRGRRSSTARTARWTPSSARWGPAGPWPASPRLCGRESRTW
jgi:cysteine synthase A